MTKIQPTRTIIASSIQKNITPKNGEVHIGIVSVTPKLATQWLDNASKVGFKNRTPSSASISKYANEMSSGKWATGTYDPIHMAVEDGVCFPINGQHRLRALVLADVTVDFLVIVGVSRMNFRYYDQGRPRDLPQIIDIVRNELSGERWKNPRDMATTARLLFKQDKTGNPTIRPNDEDNDQDGVIFDQIDAAYGDKINSLYDAHHKTLAQIQRGEKIIGQSKQSGFGPAGIWGFAMVRAFEAGCLDVFLDLAAYASAPSQNATSHTAWKTVVAYIGYLRTEAEEGHGRVMKGRHKDFSDAVTAAIFAAIRLVNDGYKFPLCNGKVVGRNGTENKWFREFNTQVATLLSSREPADWSLVS